MNARLSLPALPIKTLVCLCCLLPVGCATQQPKPARPAQAPVVTPPPARAEQPAVAPPTPVVIPAPAKPEPAKPSLAKPEPAKPVPAQPAPATVQQAPKPAMPKPIPAPITPTPAPVPSSKQDIPEAPKPAPQPVPVEPAPAKSEPVKSELQKPEPATAVPPAAKPTAPNPEAIAVDLNNLPLSINGQWTLNRDESRCTLQSDVQRMDDGQGGSKVSLWLTATEMSFLTESDIDLSYTGTGVTVDSGRHFDLETVERRTNPVFTKQRAALLDAMKSGQTLELTLGFWPSWPVTHTYSVSFPIQHFANAYAAWESCNKLLHQR